MIDMSEKRAKRVKSAETLASRSGHYRQKSEERDREITGVFDPLK